jgi:hypothetical protein
MAAMVSPSSEDVDEKPLDPAVLRVQARLRRLLLIAGLTLGLGLVAVFVGIIYRLSDLGDKPPAGAVASEAAIPAGARLVSSTVAGNRIVLTYDTSAGTTLIFVDAKSQAVVGRLDLKPGETAQSPPNSP